MTNNSVFPEIQSSYRKGHSTETALLRVVNDILMKMNSQEVTLLVLLDFSAAFGTVNHDILIKRLHEELGIADSALRWFEPYLYNRVQKVGIDRYLTHSTCAAEFLKGLVLDRFYLGHPNKMFRFPSPSLS